MARGKYQKKRSGVPLRRWLPLVMLLLVLPGIGTTAAKYVRQTFGRNLFAAKEFYFTSNLLSETNTTYVLHSEAASIQFTLGNHADDLRYSQDNVTYTISVDNDGTLSASGGTLTKGTVDSDTITLSKMKPGTTYTVTAIGKAGYEKKLSASFRRAGTEEALYKHLDTTNPAYVMLTVWTENIQGDLTVSFPAGLIPDNTDAALAGIQNYVNPSYTAGSFTDNSSFDETYASRSYRFFKTEGVSVTESDFNIMLTDGSTVYNDEVIGTP